MIQRNYESRVKRVKGNLIDTKTGEVLSFYRPTVRNNRTVQKRDFAGLGWMIALLAVLLLSTLAN